MRLLLLILLIGPFRSDGQGVSEARPHSILYEIKDYKVISFDTTYSIPFKLNPGIIRFNPTKEDISEAVELIDAFRDVNRKKGAKFFQVFGYYEDKSRMLFINFINVHNERTLNKEFTGWQDHIVLEFVEPPHYSRTLAYLIDLDRRLIGFF